MTPDIIEELIDDGKYRLTLHLTWPKLFADHLCWFPIRMRSRMEYRGFDPDIRTGSPSNAA